MAENRRVSYFYDAEVGNYHYGQVATTAPTFNRPAVNYGNPGYRYPQNSYPGYQAYPNNGNVAQQWRQRDTR